VIHLIGNLACERDWRGAGPPPEPVARRIAALATLMRAVVDADAVTVWTPVAVDPARIPAVDGLPRVALAVGAPPPGAAVLAWGATALTADARAPDPAAITAALDPIVRRALAQPTPAVEVARAVNDRRLAASIGAAVDAEPAHLLATDDDAEVDRVVAAAAAASPTATWVAKLPLTSAGRDRMRAGIPLDTDARRRLAALRAEAGGALTVEPWLDRRRDLGITGAIDARGDVGVLAPHDLVTDRHGGFRGIDVAPAPLDAAHRDRLVAVATTVGRELAARGHRGVYTVDALIHHRAGADELHPLVEINARLSFGVVARALAARLGRGRFRVGATAPPGALVLVAPTAADPSAAWLE
jgi:hypothetical protein